MTTLTWTIVLRSVIKPLCFSLNSRLDCWNLPKPWRNLDSQNTSFALHHQLLWIPQRRITYSWKDYNHSLKGTQVWGFTCFYCTDRSLSLFSRFFLFFQFLNLEYICWRTKSIVNSRWKERKVAVRAEQITVLLMKNSSPCVDLVTLPSQTLLRIFLPINSEVYVFDTFFHK